MSRFEIGLVNRGRGGRGKILIYNIVLWALCRNGKLDSTSNFFAQKK